MPPATSTSSSLYLRDLRLRGPPPLRGRDLFKGETEIVYDTNSKKTDLLVEIDGDKVGVGVVRAESYPKGSATPSAKPTTSSKGSSRTSS